MGDEKWYHYQPRVDGERLHFRFRTKKEKQEFARQFEKQRREQRLGLRSQVLSESLDDFAKGWLTTQEERVKIEELTFAAWEVFERHLRLHILPKLGHIPIDKFNVPLFDEFFHKLRVEGMSAANCNRVRTTLHSVFKSVARKGLLPANPISNIQPYEETTPKKEILDTDEKVMAWLTAAQTLGPMVLALESTFVNAGPRKAAVIALKWKDYDTQFEILTIRRIWEQASRTIVDRTKGKRSYDLGVNRSLSWALAEWRKVSKFTGPEDFIFTTPDGDYLDPTTIERINQELCRLTGFKIVPHGKRHTSGTFYRDRGGLEIARDQLGHSDQRTTESTYAQKLKERMAERANVINFLPEGVKLQDSSGTSVAQNDLQERQNTEANT